LNLQFCRATDYFLRMLNIGPGGVRAGVFLRSGPLLAVLLVVLGTGCDDRERITFPTPSDGVGPVTTIEQPAGADTTIFPGGLFSVQGATVDPDGIDTVYFLVNGGGQSFPAFVPNQLQTTVTFSLPLATFGYSGQTFEVQVYGVDNVGNRGGTSSRLIHIR
jgi:hypothetical protein